jgi:hypothetical protein
MSFLSSIMKNVNLAEIIKGNNKKYAESFYSRFSRASKVFPNRKFTNFVDEVTVELVHPDGHCLASLVYRWQMEPDNSGPFMKLHSHDGLSHLPQMNLLMDFIDQNKNKLTSCDGFCRALIEGGFKEYNPLKAFQQEEKQSE